VSIFIFIFVPYTTRAVVENSVFVQGGVPGNATQSGSAWSLKAGYMENAGTGRFLYGGQGLGSGDWTVRVKLALTQLNGSAASIVLSGVNNLILDASSFKISLEGGAWGSQGIIADSREYITPNIPFTVRLTRTGNALTIAINDRVIANRTVSALNVYSVGVRPHRNTMRLYEFSAEGNLTGFLTTPILPRTLTMGTLDFSAQRERHTVISAGSDTLYNGHVHTLRLPGTNTIYAVWTLGHGGTVYFLKRSLDNGKTWSENLPTPGNWSRTYNCPTLHWLKAPDGRARLFVFAGARAMFQSFSEDGGYTWTPMQTNGLTCIVSPMSILEAGSGKLMMWYHRGFNDSDLTPLTLWQAESIDGGLTWRNQKKLLERVGNDLCEPAVIRSPDGRRLLMFIRENQRYLNSLYMISDDEGQSWSRPLELPGDLTGDRHVARYAADGRLLVAFRDVSVTGVNSYGNLTLWVGDFDDIVGGTKGAYRVKIFHNMGGGIDSGYSGLEVLHDGSILATTYVRYNNASEKPSIVCSRINLADADLAMGIGSERSGPPVFLSQPLDREFQQDTNVVLRATVAGESPFTYQWYRNGVGIDGATSSTISIPAIRAEQGGAYSLVATNPKGSTTSQSARITVWIPSSVSLASSRRIVGKGEPVTLTATFTGTPPFRFIWQKDNNPISISSESSYTIPAMNASDVGIYSVNVENVGSSSFTNTVYLAVFGAEQTSLELIEGTDRLLISGSKMAPNRNYRIKVSSDLITWETTSRIITTDDQGEFRAEVAMVGSRRFWCLVLE
jgi:hypothetical protein